MTEQNLNYEERLQKNFLDTWIHYLEFNVTRHRRMVKLAGTPIRALIAEVIYWHELLILAEKGTDELLKLLEQKLQKPARKHSKDT